MSLGFPLWIVKKTKIDTWCYSWQSALTLWCYRSLLGGAMSNTWCNMMCCVMCKICCMQRVSQRYTHNCESTKHVGSEHAITSWCSRCQLHCRKAHCQGQLQDFEMPSRHHNGWSSAKVFLMVCNNKDMHNRGDSTMYMPLLGHGNITHLPLLEPLPSQPAAIAWFQACLCSQLVQKRT